MQENAVNKVLDTRSNASGMGNFASSNKRGMTVYSFSQLQKITGRDKDGQLMSWGMEQPYFYLSVEQRIEMFKLSSPVFGVVTSRMNRLSGLEFNITSETKHEDKMAMQMKDAKAVYEEYRNEIDLTSLTLKSNIFRNLLIHLPTLKPDLSNFNPALLRWKRGLKHRSLEECDAAKNWLMEPNAGTTWPEFIKKWVMDYYVHGSAAIYKQEQGGKIENFDVLPGGTVYRIKSDSFSNVAGYVQILPGYMTAQPEMYFSDEIIYSEYIPTSSRAYGFVPLEALINKICETLFFDELMANQADGTKPPEKLVIVTDRPPFGSMDSGVNTEIPLDVPEQKRIEEKINTPTKNSVMTFTGNTATVVDLSRENTMPIQMQRQKDIREEVALVFNMSNMEINSSGSEGTSGRNTSDGQADIEQSKGIAPPSLALKLAVQRGLLPFRFGSGLIFDFEKAKNEEEEKKLDLLSLQSRENTVNEIREKYNKEDLGEEYDKPEGAAMGATGENEMNPMFTRNIV